MITSFRTMLFPPREATTTTEPPEPLTLQHSEFIIFKQVLQQIVGPAVRLLFIPCVLWTEISCLFVPFVVSIQCLGCNLNVQAKYTPVSTDLKMTKVFPFNSSRTILYCMMGSAKTQH